MNYDSKQPILINLWNVIRLNDTLNREVEIRVRSGKPNLTNHDRCSVSAD